MHQRSPLLILLALTALVVSGCATTVHSVANGTPAADECVILVHGLSRSYRAMRPMAERLGLAGYTTVNVDYPSRSATIEELAPRVIGEGVAQCHDRGLSRINFVTHSIGGILLRYEQQRAPIDGLGRVVMLGPPNQGSELVDVGERIPLFGAIASPAGEQLGTDADGVPSSLGPVEFELGVIAGTRTANPFVSLFLPNPDDGKVSVARTRVDGMRDFAVVPRSHAFMMRHPSVIALTERFLKTGCFAASGNLAGCRSSVQGD